jgi:hypothetical protein
MRKIKIAITFGTNHVRLKHGREIYESESNNITCIWIFCSRPYPESCV